MPSQRDSNYTKMKATVADTFSCAPTIKFRGLNHKDSAGWVIFSTLQIKNQELK